MCGNNDCECLTKTLCTIVKLQKQGECIDSSLTSCDRPYLGINNNNIYNTRPITLYTCPGNIIWCMLDTLEKNTGKSTVFIIEDVEDCCATFRFFAPAEATYEISALSFHVTFQILIGN